MVVIYAIEDINDVIYVGSTIQKLSLRLSKHRTCKKDNNYYSSSKLNLDYCIIYELEKCEEKDRKEREQYWIDKLDCVNDNNTIKDVEYRKKYQLEKYHKNKEEINRKKREYRKKNKEEMNKKEKEYRDKNKETLNRQQREYRKRKKELSE